MYMKENVAYRIEKVQKNPISSPSKSASTFQTYICMKLEGGS